VDIVDLGQIGVQSEAATASMVDHHQHHWCGVPDGTTAQHYHLTSPTLLTVTASPPPASSSSTASVAAAGQTDDFTGIPLDSVPVEHSSATGDHLNTDDVPDREQHWQQL